MATNSLTCLRILVNFLFIPLFTSTFVFRGFTYPFDISLCEMQKVASLLQCANLCSQSAGVTFFFEPSNMSCRWKCLTMNAVGNLTNGWKSYELYSIGNVALGKPASSSSVFQNDQHLYGPNLAVDGVLDHGVYGEGPGCFLTAQEIQSYLQINLGREYLLIFIRVFTGDRLHDVRVSASPAVGGEFTFCGFYKGPGRTGQVIDIRCRKGTTGQIVKIQIISGILSFLQLCEVEVYAL